MKYAIYIIIFILILAIASCICLIALKNDNSDKINSKIKNESLNYSNLKTLTGFIRPIGINIDSQNNLYVADFELNAIFVYDSNLNFKKQIGTSGSALGLFDRPHSIDFDIEENIYITEFGNKRIQKFSKEGEFISVINSSKNFEGPATAYFDKYYNLYVADFNSNSILKFNKNMKFIGWIGEKTDNTLTNGWEKIGMSVKSKNPGAFDRPHIARVDSDGMLYVADTWNHRIEKFSSNGEFMGWIGEKTDNTLTNGWEKTGTAINSGKEGGFNAPISIEFDESNLIILEFGNQRIQKFSKEGEFISVINLKDILPFYQAYDIKIKNNVLYLADTGNKRVQIIPFD